MTTIITVETENILLYNNVTLPICVYTRAEDFLVEIKQFVNKSPDIVWH